MQRSLSCVCAVLALAAAAAAQDLVGVGWSGQIVLIDSFTGVATPAGNGLLGQNSLGRDGNGIFWSTARTGSSAATWVNYFTAIDPSAGTATIVHSNTPDIRGLAVASGSLMYGIHNTVAGSVSSIDDLVLVDMSNGTFTTIGSTGLTALQALTNRQGTLYAWDLTLGLVTIDPNTGAATDPFPGVGGPSGVQCMCAHPDGRLLLAGGSGNALYSVDVTTGATTLIGATAGAIDLRGLEALGGFAVPFGQACNGAFGPATLSSAGNVQVGSSLTLTSINHAPGVLGALVVGLSNTVHAGLSLPLLLDPILGTSSCYLNVSIDGSLIGFANANNPADLVFTLPLTPPFAGQRFYVQHAAFEPVPGGLSWSNGVAIDVQ